MKKKIRRLQLSKETLVHLQGGTGVAGNEDGSYTCMDPCIDIQSDCNYICRVNTTC